MYVIIKAYQMIPCLAGMLCCSECEALPNPARDDPGGGGNSGQPNLQLRCRPGTRNGLDVESFVHSLECVA